MILRNYYSREKWFEMVKETLIEHGYKKPLTLCSKSWGGLFEMNLHPVEAICEMEELPLIRVVVCFTRVKQKLK